jgi:Zn-dependent M16 (insulinase) family peptidase
LLGHCITLLNTGETDADRQTRRDGVIDTSVQDFKDFAQRLEKVRDNGSIVVFGSQAALDTANESLPSESKLSVETAVQSK